MNKKQGMINYCPVCHINRLFQFINVPVYTSERDDSGKKHLVRVQRCQCEKCGYNQNYKLYED